MSGKLLEVGRRRVFVVVGGLCLVPVAGLLVWLQSGGLTATAISTDDSVIAVSEDEPDSSGTTPTGERPETVSEESGSDEVVGGVDLGRGVSDSDGASVAVGATGNSHLGAPIPGGSCSVPQLTVGAAITPTSINPEPRVVVQSGSSGDIEAAIEQIQEAKGGTLHFPAGTYVIEQDGKASRSVLYFTDLEDFKITGDGVGETKLVLEQSPDGIGKQLRNITVLGANRVEVSDLSVIGQKDYYTPSVETQNPNFPIGEGDFFAGNLSSREKLEFANKEQQSALFVRGVTGSSYIHDAEFIDAGGDGINITDSANIVIDNNVFDDNDRNGVTLGGVRGQERSANVLISNNFFGPGIDTQQIDLELHGSAPFTNSNEVRNGNIQIVSNTFAPRAVEDTIDGDQYAATLSESNEILVEGNDFGGNPFLASYADNVRIFNNTNIGGGRIFRKWSTLDIAANTFDLAPITRNNWPTVNNGGLVIQEAANEPVGNVTLRSNTIVSKGVKWPVFIHGLDQGLIFDNTITAIGHETIVNVESNVAPSEIGIFANSFTEASVEELSWGKGSIALDYSPSGCN